jgi:hypothetical protein
MRVIYFYYKVMLYLWWEVGYRSVYLVEEVNELLEVDLIVRLDARYLYHGCTRGG